MTSLVTQSPEKESNKFTIVFPSFGDSSEEFIDIFIEFSIDSLLPDLKDIFIDDEFEKIYFLLKNHNGTLDNCLLNCSNHGACVYENNDFACSCDEFYTGESCEEDTRPCSNKNTCQHGNCTDIIIDSVVSGYYCNCTELYEGGHCQYKKKICDQFKCGNGVCIPLTEESIKCVCFDGFTGKFCDLKQKSLMKRNITAKSAVITSICMMSFFLSLLLLIDSVRLINWFMKT